MRQCVALAKASRRNAASPTQAGLHTKTLEPLGRQCAHRPQRRILTVLDPEFFDEFIARDCPARFGGDCGVSEWVASPRNWRGQR